LIKSFSHVVGAARVVLETIENAIIMLGWNVAELAFLGSVLRDDFKPDSDVDVLITFIPGTRVGLITLGKMEQELETLLGRKVDLVTKGSLKPLIRDNILSAAEVLYAA